MSDYFYSLESLLSAWAGNVATMREWMEVRAVANDIADENNA